MNIGDYVYLCDEPSMSYAHSIQGSGITVQETAVLQLVVLCASIFFF